MFTYLCSLYISFDSESLMISIFYWYSWLVILSTLRFKKINWNFKHPFFFLFALKLKFFIFSFRIFKVNNNNNISLKLSKIRRVRKKKMILKSPFTLKELKYKSLIRELILFIKRTEVSRKCVHESVSEQCFKTIQ